MLVYSNDLKLNPGIMELIRSGFNEDPKIINSVDKIKNNEKLLIIGLKTRKNEDYIKSELYKNNKLLDSNIQIIKESSNNLDRSIKKSIIKLIKNYTDIFPWGILTGIRPIKIGNKLLDKGFSEVEIKKYLKNNFLVSDDKANLSLEVLRNQREILLSNKGKYSIYISIPFCPTTCSYCSFPSLPISRYKEYVNDYVNLLLYELDSVFRILNIKNLNTVYIGGGTPTSIPVEELTRIIKYFNGKRKDIREITVEAGRPDTLDGEYLKELFSNKVNRISINPQTMNDKTLKLIGRSHSSKDIINIYKLAKKIGFENINMDLIIGLPNESLDDIKFTLDKIYQLKPSNLTIHNLAIKRGSNFSLNLENYRLLSVKEMNYIYDYIDKIVKKLGLKPYYLYRQKQALGNLENIGYSKDGKSCIYNISMIEERENIIGIGLGAVNKLLINGKITRLANFKGIDHYFNRIDELVHERNIYLNKI